MSATTPYQFGHALALKWGASAPTAVEVGDLFESDSLASHVVALKVNELVTDFQAKNLIGPAAIFPAAAAVDIGSSNSRLINITGSGSISSFGTISDLQQSLYMIAALGSHTVVASANMLTPAGSNLTFDAGASYWVQYMDAGVWRVYPFGLVEGDSAPGQKLRILRVATSTWAYTTAHRGWLVEFDAACIVTLPTAADDGENFMWQQNTAGQITFVKSSGGNPVNFSGYNKSAGQYASGNCILSDGAGWIINGTTGV